MKLTLLSAVVVIVLSLWLFGSILVQLSYLWPNHFRKNPQSLLWRRAKALGLLPRWTFFSWVPEYDFMVAYRDQLRDGSLTRWRMIEMPARSCFRFLWNPGRRKRKLLEDLCIGLLSSPAMQLQDSECLASSRHYSMLAQYVAHFPSVRSEARQFMVLRIFGNVRRTPEILFVSPSFRCPAAAGQE